MEKGGIAFLVVVVLFLISLSYLGSSQNYTVPTRLEAVYNNTPPVFHGPIPNQTWAWNTNLTNAFDLDDYFSHAGPLSYTASFVENITVVINSTTHQVSFYPDHNFTGVRQVRFNATDVYGESTLSDNVTLNVVFDNEPPQWGNVTMGNGTIYTGTTVSFFANWTDNFGLGSYFFSIDQGSGFVDQSAVSFSGIQNTSIFKTPITAAGGTTVRWKFTAYDASGNMNVTDIQSFTVTSLPTPPGGGTTPTTGTGGTGGAGAGTPSGGISAKKGKLTSDFTIDAESFKLEIKQGSRGTIATKVTNIGNTNLTFAVQILGLEMFTTTISDTNFSLGAGESKLINVDFLASLILAPEVYYGTFSVAAPNITKEVPIAIIVKPLETVLDLNVNVLDAYKNVRPGEIVSANFTLENLKDIQEKNIEFYYALLDFKGNVLDSRTENFVFSERSINFEKNLTVPTGIEKGDYMFFGRVVSNKDVSLDADIFKVGEKFSALAFLKANLLFLFLILLALIAAILMVRHYRSKEKLRLLNLYLMVTEMNKLMKEGKTDEAIDLYIRIKAAYGLPVSKTAIENTDQLKKEMQKLYQGLEEKIEAGRREAQKTEQAKEAKPDETKKEVSKEEKKSDEAEVKPTETKTQEVKISEPEKETEKEKTKTEEVKNEKK
jgi:hypothetical protein